jgi:hypothetical protein
MGAGLENIVKICSKYFQNIRQYFDRIDTIPPAFLPLAPPICSARLFLQCIIPLINR